MWMTQGPPPLGTSSVDAPIGDGGEDTGVLESITIHQDEGEASYSCTSGCGAEGGADYEPQMAEDGAGEVPGTFVGSEEASKAKSVGESS